MNKESTANQEQENWRQWGRAESYANSPEYIETHQNDQANFRIILGSQLLSQ